MTIVHPHGNADALDLKSRDLFAGSEKKFGEARNASRDSRSIGHSTTIKT